MKILGLTGGIGSGKSTVKNLFADLGVPTIDVDQIVALAYKDTSSLLSQNMIKRYGKHIVIDNEISKLMLRQEIESKNDWNTAMVLAEDYVMKELKTFNLKYFDSPYIVWEVALLFESNLHESVDYVLSVIVDKETQIKRVLERNSNLKLEQVEKVIASQMDNNTKKNRSDFVIENNKGLNDLVKEVKNIDEIIRNLNV